MDGKNFLSRTGLSALSVIILALLIAFRCDDEQTEFFFMIFEIPVQVSKSSPGETMKIGDTLWVKGKFPDTLYEVKSKEYYKLSDFGFKSNLCLHRLIDPELYLSQQPTAFNAFSLLGTFQVSSNCSTFPITYQDNLYTYNIGFVPQDTGVFNIFILYPINLHNMPDEQIDLRPYVKLSPVRGKKRIPVYEAFQFVINDGNTNFELYKQYCKQGLDIVPSEELGSFTFRVVE